MPVPQADVGPRTFTTVGELLRIIITNPAGMRFEFIVIVPLLPLLGASSLSLDLGYLFLVGSSVLLIMDVQQLVVILVFSQVKISAHPSILPS